MMTYLKFHKYFLNKSILIIVIHKEKQDKIQKNKIKF